MMSCVRLADMNFDDPILAEESIVDEALLDIGEILVVGAL